MQPAALNSFHSAIYCCVGLAVGVLIIACVAYGINGRDSGECENNRMPSSTIPTGTEDVGDTWK